MKCKDCSDVSCTRRRSENSECFFEEDLRKQKELEEIPYWEHFRAEAAKDILCAIISQPNLGYYGDEVENAVIFADKLISKLKEEEEK